MAATVGAKAWKAALTAMSRRFGCHSEHSNADYTAGHSGIDAGVTYSSDAAHGGMQSVESGSGSGDSGGDVDVTWGEFLLCFIPG